MKDKKNDSILRWGEGNNKQLIFLTISLCSSVIAIESVNSGMFSIQAALLKIIFFLFIFSVSRVITDCNRTPQFVLISYCIFVLLGLLLPVSLVSVWLGGLVVLFSSICCRFLTRKNKLLFIAIVVLKLILGSVFANDLDDFIRFGKFYLSSNYADPWQWASSIDFPSMFPYPAGLLYYWVGLLSGLRSELNFNVLELGSFASYFSVRSLMLLADLAIFSLLVKQYRSLRAGLFWFLNPLVILIFYVYGQLDLFLIFPFLYFIPQFFERPKLAIFGICFLIALKTNYLLILPLLFLFLIYHYGSFHMVALLVFGLLFVSKIVPIEFMHSSFYHKLVANSGAKFVPFFVKLPVVLQYNFHFFIGVLCLIYFLINDKRIFIKSGNQMLYACSIILLIPVITTLPSLAWVSWSLPGLCLYYAKRKLSFSLEFFFFNMSWFLFLLFWDNNPLSTATDLLAASSAFFRNIIMYFNPYKKTLEILGSDWMPIFVNSLLSIFYVSGFRIVFKMLKPQDHSSSI